MLWYLILVICPGVSTLGCSSLIVAGPPYKSEEACKLDGEAARKVTGDRFYCIRKSPE